MEDIWLGIIHITDFEGFDHMLYLVALAAWADLQNTWRILLMATAFTLGHSITLAMAGLDWIRPNGAWIEFLIPVSILFTALYNTRRGLTQKRRGPESQEGFDALGYAVTLGFGLIHGLGFSTFFRMTRDGAEALVWGLFKFNLGVELGQICILLVFLTIASFIRGFGVTPREQQLFFAGAAAGLSLIMALERIPF